MHEPSVRVLKSIGEALNVSAETLFEQAGLTRPAENLDDEATENTIRSDQLLSEEQRHALLEVYRSYVGANTEIRFRALPPIERSGHGRRSSPHST
jgi:hypothetical protein